MKISVAKTEVTKERFDQAKAAAAQSAADQAKGKAAAEVPPEAHAMTLRQIIDRFGGLVFDLPIDNDGNTLPVSLKEFEGRDLDSTYISLGYRKSYTLEESMALGLKSELPDS